MVHSHWSRIIETWLWLVDISVLLCQLSYAIKKQLKLLKIIPTFIFIKQSAKAVSGVEKQSDIFYMRERDSCVVSGGGLSVIRFSANKLLCQQSVNTNSELRTENTCSAWHKFREKNSSKIGKTILINQLKLCYKIPRKQKMTSKHLTEYYILD